MYDYSDEFGVLKNYLRRKSAEEQKNLCVSFDIGSHAARALIGPVISAEELKAWNPDEMKLFHTQLRSTNLGTDAEKTDNKLDLESNALKRTISLINTISRFLEHTPKENYVLVGTAIFRKLLNREEVIKYIQEKTGFKLTVIDAKSEAYLNLKATFHTQGKISGNEPFQRSVSDKDLIVLFDQGGASTEVSCIAPSDPAKITLCSLKLGTNNLQIFLREVIKAQLAKNKNAVDDMLGDLEKSLRAHIDKNLLGFEEIFSHADRYQISAYGMGTAIKICFEEHCKKEFNRPLEAKNFNGWSMTNEQLNGLCHDAKNKVTAKYKTNEALFKALENPNLDEEIKTALRFLYALPVYKLLMDKFAVNNIAYEYFNLRYGIYFHRFVQGVCDMNELSAVL